MTRSAGAGIPATRTTAFSAYPLTLRADSRRDPLRLRSLSARPRLPRRNNLRRSRPLTFTMADAPAADALPSLGFLGGGMMAEAILAGLLAKKMVSPANVWVAEIFAPRRQLLSETLPGINLTDDANVVVQETSILIVAVKPNCVESLLSSLALDGLQSKLFVSIAAGLSISKLQNWLPQQGVPVIRVMPNTPCLVGAAASAYSPGTSATSKHVDLVETIFSAVGLVVKVEERLLDAVTGVSGSGPAYVYMLIEAMGDAGVAQGLSRDTARRLAAQCVMGSAKMALDGIDKNIHVAELRNRVESPGGTTIAASAALEKTQFRHAVIEAVNTAANRSKEIGASNQ